VKKLETIAWTAGDIILTVLTTLPDLSITAIVSPNGAMMIGFEMAVA
jgi:hypothetical protein